MNSRMPNPLQVLIIIAICGGLWKLAFDRLAAWLVPNLKLLLQINTNMGCLIPGVTAIWFHPELRRESPLCRVNDKGYMQ